MSLTPLVGEHLRIDPLAIVAHAQSKVLVVVAEVDLDPPGLRVPEGIPKGTYAPHWLQPLGSSLAVNACNCPMAQDEKVFQVAPNFTKAAGNHTLRFGGDARDADILTSERKTMNGSTEADTAHRPALGWACWRERQRADAERVEGIAAMRPWPHIGDRDPR